MITDRLLLADEPTGRWTKISKQYLIYSTKSIKRDKRFFNGNAQQLLLSKSPNAFFFIKDGLIYNQLYREGRTDQQMFELIQKH